MSRRALGLAGRRVIVTRAADQAGALLALLRARGAEPFACPTIAIEAPASYAPLDAAIRTLNCYDWLVFTSANAVASFADRLDAGHVAVPGRTRIAAVGRATARKVAERLRAPDFVPSIALAATVAAELPDAAGSRVLFPRGDLASEALVSGLHARGAVVDDVVAYRTVAGEGVAHLRHLVRGGGIDAILFMSASSLRFLGGAADALGPPDTPTWLGSYPVVICIGPETARAARDAGIDVTAVATDKSAEGVVDALERWYAREHDAERR
jgi:uroporphyrinogen-III synthase